MFTFSPQYNMCSIIVKEERHNSMRTWVEPHVVSHPHLLNGIGYIPFIGGTVAAGFRSVAAVADIVMGLFLCIIGSSGAFQLATGMGNLARASVEFLPTAVLLLSATPLTVTIVSIGTILVLIGTDFFSCSGISSNAPAALFYDQTCVKELSPNEYCYYQFDQCVEELRKYGTTPPNASAYWA